MLVIIRNSDNYIVSRVREGSLGFMELARIVAPEPEDNFRVVPIVEVDPEFDPQTQSISGWVETVEAGRLLRERTVVNLSPAEIDAITAARLDGVAVQLDRGEDILRALMKLLVSEFNRHQKFETDLLAAIAAASSLANFQTRAAAISVVPQRDFAQLRAAIRSLLAA